MTYAPLESPIGEAIRVKVRPFAVANAMAAMDDSAARWWHCFERCKEAFEPFGREGILYSWPNGDTQLESEDGIWSWNDPPTHVFSPVSLTG